MNGNYEFSLMQLADSFFPSGNFALSGGLEALVRSSRIKDKQDIKEFLKSQLYCQLRPCDCAILALSYDAASRLDLNDLMRIDNLFFSMKLVEVVRTSSVRAGQQLLNNVIAILAMPKTISQGNSSKSNQVLEFAKAFRVKIRDKQTRGTLPVCLAVCAWANGIPKRSALRLFLYCYLVSTVGSAVRLGIVEHTLAQSMIASLRDDCDLISQTVQAMKIDELWQVTPLVDILQMNHEKDELRMFIT
jgi:urease accessory protein